MEQENQLNEEQQAVVAELDRHVLLIASAGTGKTNTLACRIANILAQGRAAAEEILCLTFTNKACHEMRDRIVARVQTPGLGVRVKTFHGFCYDIVKSAAKENSDIFTDFIIFDEEDCKEIIKSLNVQHYPVMKLQLFIEEVKKMSVRAHLFSDDRLGNDQQAVALLFEKKQEWLSQLCSDSKGRIDLEMLDELRLGGADFVYRYDQQLQDMHGLDFTDLIARAYELLQRSDIRRYWQDQFRYINVDEVQDTSELEYELLTCLFGTSNILFCGDYFQTIYEWRGSNPLRIIDEFRRAYHPVCIAFDKNYRATRTLLDASYACLRNLFPSLVHEVYDHDIQAMSHDIGDQITVAGFSSYYAEAQWIYDTIQTIPDAAQARVCILTRRNYYNQQLSRYFNGFQQQHRGQHELKFMLVDQYQFFRRQEIKDVLAFVKLIINRHDVSSMVRILKRFAPGIGAKTIDTIQSDEYRRAGVRITDYLNEQAVVNQDPFALLMQELERDNVVVFDVESTGTNTSNDEIIQLAAVRIDRNGQVIDTFMHYVKNHKSVGSSAVVHHITDDYLAAHGEDASTVLSSFLKFIAGSVVVGHNVSFDITILKSQLLRLGLGAPKFMDFYDTLDIFRRFYPNLKNHKLEYLSQHFAIAHQPTHDAFDDIMATAGILMYAIKENIQPTTAERRHYMAAHGRVFQRLAELIQHLHDAWQVQRPHELIGRIVNEGGVKDCYQADETRMRHLRELYLKAKEEDDPSVSSLDALVNFQTYTSLAKSEIDAMLERKPQIPIITVHQAKGMEFDYVIMAGMHEGEFPSYQSLKSGNLEEEKRVFYVGITRAKKGLFLTYCRSINGQDKQCCRFIEAIPEKARKER